MKPTGEGGQTTGAWKVACRTMVNQTVTVRSGRAHGAQIRMHHPMAISRLSPDRRRAWHWLDFDASLRPIAVVARHVMSDCGAYRTAGVGRAPSPPPLYNIEARICCESRLLSSERVERWLLWRSGARKVSTCSASKALGAL
jgi:hypothetical protein